jgi:hypothetical protein
MQKFGLRITNADHVRHHLPGLDKAHNPEAADHLLK